MNFQFFKMILVLLFMQAVTMVNVNSHSGIYDLSGKCKQEIYCISYVINVINVINFLSSKSVHEVDRPTFKSVVPMDVWTAADDRLRPSRPVTGLCCFSFFKTYL